MDGNLDIAFAAPTSGGMTKRGRRRVPALLDPDAKLPWAGAPFVAAGQLHTVAVSAERHDVARQRDVMKGHRTS